MPEKDLAAPIRRDLPKRWFYLGCIFLSFTLLMVGYAFLRVSLDPSQLLLVSWLMSISSGFAAGFFVGGITVKNNSLPQRLILSTSGGFAVWAVTFFALPTIFKAYNVRSTSELVNEFKNESALNRVYEDRISYILVNVRWATIMLEDISLLILARGIDPIRLDFSITGVLLNVKGHKGLAIPITPIAQQLVQEERVIRYPIDLNFLRQMDSDHPLSKLTLRQLDNAPAHLLLKDNVRQQLLSTHTEDKLSIEFTAEVSGYHVPIFSENFELTQNNLQSLMPRAVPDKPGFVMMLHYPEWRVKIEKIEKAQISFESVEKSVDYVDRKNHLTAWRNIWPDRKTLSLFHSLQGVPMEENQLQFHPRNQQFVRLREDFAKSGECIVPGISAFQLPDYSKFYLFASVLYEGAEKDLIQFQVAGESLSLSSNETVTIHNILRQMTILNKMWVDIEGNYVHGLVVLLPKRKKYIQLDAIRYYEYSSKHPIDKGASLEQVLTGLVQNSAIRIGRL